MSVRDGGSGGAGGGEGRGRSRLAILVNPHAGGGRSRRLWRRLLADEPWLAGGPGGPPGGIRRIEEEEPRAAQEALVKALEAGVDRLVVVGGDGTFSLAADVVAVAGAGQRVVLGLVPAGTGSDLARTLKLPSDPRRCLGRALDAPDRPLDALEVLADDGRRRFAVNVLSGGVSSRVVAEINDPDRPGRGGRGAYLAGALRGLRAYRPAPCRVAVEGTEGGGPELLHEGPLLLFAVANGRSFGGGMKIAPGAEPDDGLAEVVLAAEVPARAIPLLLPRLYLGKHLGSRHVEHRRGERVRLEPGPGFPPFDLDGDVWPPGGSTTPAVTVTVRPAALRVAS